MQDKYKTKAELITELEQLRRKAARLEKAEARRKQAEDKLRQAERKYRIVADNTCDWEFWLGPDGRFVYVSPACERITGYTADEFMADPNLLNRIVHPDDAGAFECHQHEVDQAASSGRVEFRIIHKDRTLRWIEHICRAIFDDEGCYLGSRGSNRDITERKQIEEALRQANERMEATLNALPDLLFEVDRDGRIYSYHTLAAQALYAPPEAFIGKTVSEVLPPKAAEVCLGALEAAASQGRSIGKAYALPMPDGTRWYELSIAAMGRPELTECHFVVLSRDITERIQAQATLRAHEERYRNLFEGMAEGVAVYQAWQDGKDFVFVDFNRGGEQIEQIDRREVIGRKVSEVFPGVKAFGLFEVFQRVWRTGQPEHYPVALYQDDRMAGWRENYVYKLPSGEIVAVYSDATERKQAEEALVRERDFVARIAETSPVGITVLDEQGQIIFANQRAEEILGLTRDEITRRTYNAPAWQITDYAGQPFPEQELPFVRVKATGQPVNDIRHAIRWPDGRQVFLSVNASPLIQEGRLAGVVASLHDISDIIRAEEALRESEFKFRSLVEQAAEMLYFHDLNGRILDVNQAAVKRTGYTRQELLQMRAFDIDPDYVEREDVGGFWDRLEPGQPLTFEARHRTRSGEIFPVEITLGKILLRGDTFILALARDITERKQAEAALRRSRALLQDMERITQVGGWEYSVADRRLAWTDGVYRIHGVSKDAYDPNDISRNVHFYEPHEQARIAAAFERAVETGEPYDLELEFRNAQGEKRWVRTIGRAEQQAGRVVRVLGNIMDITERKRAEEALRKREQEFKTLVENTPDVIARFDRQCRHIYVNPIVEQEFGRPPQAILGKTHRELGYPPEMADWSESVIRQVFESGKEIAFELAYPTSAGVKYYLSRGVPEFAADGSVESALFIHRNITAYKQAEEQYQTLFREMLDGFAVHEIILDEQGRPADYRFLAVNPAFERLTGLRAGDLVGKTVRQVLPHIEQHWIDIYGQVALTGQPAHFENYAREMGRHYQVRAFRPAPGQFACIFVDVTERIKAEEKIKASLRENEALLKEIHHRVKNNMQLILSLMHLQAAQITDARALDLFKAAEGRIRAMSLVQERLYQPPNLAQVRLADYVRRLAANLYQALRVNPDEVRPVVEVGDDVALNIDKAVPCGLLINELLSNSLRHAFPDRDRDRDREVRVWMRAEGGKMVLAASDNGIGLPHDVDWRNPPTLGLRLVNILAGQLGASIELDCSEGTRFTVRFEA